MTPLATLTSLFLKQLIRRKWVWIVIVLFGGMLLINYMVQSRMDEAIGKGVSYNIATRQAASVLESYVRQIRAYSVFFVLVVSAMVAPASRKDGTSQFVLTLSVSRFKLALSQYVALSLFILTAVIIVHGGYVAAALRLGFMSPAEIAFSWVFLLIPLIFYSAAVFSFSLAHSAIVTYLVFFAIPYIVFGLAQFGIRKIAEYLPMFIIRFINNLGMLFPDIDELIIWPKLSTGMIFKDPPFPDWTWIIIHMVLTSSFWILLGLWFYRNYDFGSRTVTK